MTTAERLRAQGMAKGMTKGISKGVAKGIAKGMARGRVQGRLQGSIETLLRLLSRRFGTLPPAVTRRVRAANKAELDTWTDRILVAQSLNDLFADD